MEFTTEKDIKPSPMERYIANELDLLGIEYFQEVKFKKCFNPSTQKQLRFDFYIPSKNVLIEYDGINYHITDSELNRDSIKTQFAINYNITLFRIQGKEEIKACLSKLTKMSKSKKHIKKNFSNNNIKVRVKRTLSNSERISKCLVIKELINNSIEIKKQQEEKKFSDYRALQRLSKV